MTSEIKLAEVSYIIKTGLIGAILAFLFLACEENNDCPVCPEPKPVSNYNFYIGLFGGNRGVYIFNTERMAIVDSILGLPEHDNIEVTVAEDYLIGSKATGGSNTWIMDLNSRTFVTQFSYYGKVEVSPNGEFIAIQTPQKLRVLDSQSFGEVTQDSIVLGGGHFDIAGNIFIGIGSGNSIVRFDVPGDSIISTIKWTNPLPYGAALGKVLPTVNENKVYLWARYGTLWSVVYAYYMDIDSSYTVYEIGSENVDLELTPDHKNLVFTDPFNFDNPTKGNVFIADVEHDHVESIVPSPFIRLPTWLHRLNSSEIAFTPDGKFCLFASVESQWQGLLNVVDREYDFNFRIDSTASGAYGRSVTCRLSVK